MTDNIHEMSDEALSGIAGGMSKDLAAAYDVMNGKYGNGEDRKRRLADAGYDYWTVQNLVNGLAKGYDTVARDVINGKYGSQGLRPRSGAGDRQRHAEVSKPRQKQSSPPFPKRKGGEQFVFFAPGTSCVIMNSNSSNRGEAGKTCLQGNI